MGEPKGIRRRSRSRRTVRKLDHCVSANVGHIAEVGDGGNPITDEMPQSRVYAYEHRSLGGIVRAPWKACWRTGGWMGENDASYIA